MRCPVCKQADVKTSRENVRWTQSGLSNLTLAGVEVTRCPNCGDEGLLIPRIEELNRTIAHAVAQRLGRLNAEEIRFLRKYLGWSGVDFAKHMGVTPEQVSRWENDASPMGATAERLLRVMVFMQPPVEEYPLDRLVEVGEGIGKAPLMTAAVKAERWEVKA